jgi:hypothetical protein
VPSLLLRMLSQQALDRADRIRAIGLDPAEDRNLYADLFCRVTEADVPALSWVAP